MSTTEEPLLIIERHEQVREECVKRAKIIRTLSHAAERFAEEGRFVEAAEMFDALIFASDAREARMAIRKGSALTIEDRIEAWNVKGRP